MWTVKSKCSGCGKSCSAPTYGCNKCQYFLHQSCVDVPLEIQHFFHPCPLSLRIQPKSFNCGACDRTIQGFYFYCEWCNFSMDIECALLPTRECQSDEEQFCHLCHGHPLTLTEISEDDQSYCSACRSCCSGPTFVCRMKWQLGDTGLL
ncbi:unnamed protein product [Dovyalis caffra]|uniref:DC1 domain-containing protein n=1 Tax=Dovyalis caffra TaxID=77055 RepID=A0AAV1RPS4_9ROSI|nr:unnamed protein product [Dovyalis caffra]